ncbi:Nuclear envelope morphology protein 1 [Elasticomyces elasticus]|nr:Nuclear envelope morphology protein 1 [Elasticomyces elasticus]
MLKAMNSLNIVSRLTTTPPPSRSRTSSASQQQQEQYPLEGSEEKPETSAYDLDLSALSARLGAPKDDTEDEKTPLLGSKDSKVDSGKGREGRLWQVPKRIAHAVLYGATVVFSTLAAPGRYVIACFYDHDGHFSAVMPLRNFRTLLSRRKGGKRRSAASKPETLDVAGEKEIQPKPKRTVSSAATKRTRDSSISSPLTSEDERTDEKDTPARHTRSQTSNPTTAPDLELAPHRKTAKVKLLPNDEALRKRKSARQASKTSNTTSEDLLASSLKSPSSPTSTSSKLTKYPRLPAPPRPLVPRRQPSYTLSYSPTAPKKTLVIDLDETLIHSMARGGRMGTGHMVEVRLNQNYSSSTGPGAPGLAPGVPILYYVHPRPYVHHFLRTMSLYFSLVVFTASVQEYADPVVDWLERERKYFDKRLYRQHCSQRGGMFVKDLSRVEADLSRVVILDNFPGSYVFQEDNAIPIEGWISDPTDRELLHLIPLLEGLQYVTDVRAILQLRQGQGVVA